MNEHEKVTVAATLAALEEVVTTLLSRVLAHEPQENLEALNQRMRLGPMLRPDAPLAHDIDTADQIAGYGMEYNEAINRIYGQALALSGRQVAQ